MITTAEDRVDANEEEVDVKLKNYYNFNYVGTIYVGNPPQELRAIFDSGSANLWVISNTCNSKRDIESEN